jgi:zinc/manganese transport system substrate-binding protein/manganese/iron transport system substrate-binding protein
MRLDISWRLAILVIAATIVATACGSGPGASPGSTGPATASPEPGALQVIASTTVLADLVANVGGTKITVESLVPKGGEVHTFDPTPSDLTRVAQAQLVVMNGLGMDEWLAQMVTDSGTTAPVVELAEDLPGVTYLEGGEEAAPASPAPDASADPHAHGGVNPHLWLNVKYASLYVGRIVDALSAADPADAATYQSNGTAYQARLATLDTWVRDQMATIPQPNRKLVSFHEAFPYYAAAYGLEIVGTIVQAPGQDPSAGEIAALVEAIKASGAKAVFTEAQFSPELAQAVASEADVKVVSDLYNDSLGDPPVDSYEGLIRWDTEKTVEALK